MKNKRLENSVKNLITVYTVVIGVALTLAIVELVNPDEGLNSVTLSAIFLFIAFIITMIPFYHGALRHLDDVYIENDNPHLKKEVLLFDFAFLFLHGIAFVILSLLLSRPGQFAWILIILLVIDIAWGLFVHYVSSLQGPYSAEGRWALINSIFVIAGAFLLIINNIYLEDIPISTSASAIIMILCVSRTIADYYFCGSFYFPKE